MDKKIIEQINTERFEDWKKQLAQINATPVLIIGIKYPQHEFCILTLEDVTDEKLKLTLQIVLHDLQ